MTDQFLRFPARPLQPGGYSTLDTASLATAARVQGAPVLGILGDSKGGKPNSILRFVSAQTAKTILRSGDLYDTVRAAFLGGASEVLAVRVGNGVAQATKALVGATGTPVTLTSIDYGTWNNNLKITVGANNKVTLTYADPLGNTYTENWAVGAAATAQQVVDAINGKAVGFAKSAYVTAAVTAGTMPLTAAAVANMAGGADTGAIVSGDWTNGLTPLEAVQADLIVPATGDATVHAQVKAHCDATSTVLARKERTAVQGGVLGETAVQAAARAAAIGANRSQLVWPGLYLYDDTGVSTLYAPYICAGLVAGMHAALPDQATSLVHAIVPQALDTEKVLSTVPGGELDVALAGGVTPFNAADGGGIWIVDSLSTNLSVPLLADFHKIRTADAVARGARRRLEDRFVGGKSLNGTAQSMANEATAYLDEIVRAELVRDRAPVQIEQDPADPRTFMVGLPVILPDTTKFVLITVALRPPQVTSATAA